MKSTYLLVFAALLFVLPVAAGVTYGAESPKGPPPIGQMLVREGDYAVKLAQALKVRPATTEADAESALAGIGVAPKNGWISDFPVTPDIIAEIQNAIDAAAGSGKLTMSKADAYKAFEALNAEAGLLIVPGTPGVKGYTETPPSEDETVINNYYSDDGPPVITYYAPPPDYAYLYEWDAFPFWCDGFFFPGFFVLSDFDFDGDFGHRHHRHTHEFGRHWHNHGMISNHVIDPASKKNVSIDPISKLPRSATSFRPIGAGSAAGRPSGERSRLFEWGRSFGGGQTRSSGGTRSFGGGRAPGDIGGGSRSIGGGGGRTSGGGGGGRSSGGGGGFGGGGGRGGGSFGGGRGR
jgi:hypothetical protein